MNVVQQQAGLHFSVSQWQDFELHALIFRHIVNGAAVPPELLHLLNKSITTPSSTDSSSSSLYYASNPFQYFPHYHSALMQSGYWGKAAMDPEPGRCRRTDGKKWRCSRDVVAGHKYCERHVHRGKNRSRKHVETPTALFDNGAADDDDRKTADSAEGGGAGTAQFRSMNLLQFQQRAPETKCPFQVLNDSGGRDRTLRPFFDDWPRSGNEPNDGSRSLTTNLSISVAGNSDFSLKLGTGNEDEPRSQAGSNARERNWIATWESASNTLGGPLAEALRSSSSNPYSASGAT